MALTMHNHATIPSLDGLRAVSIAIVFFAHAHIGLPLPGGFGVTVFFFLSGFLITTLFQREAEAAGGIDLRAFYIRRLLRLSPPLLVTLAVTYGLVAAGIFLGKLVPGAMLSQLLYYYNYYQVLVPDWNEGARGLNVLWSLAVEEHFYLIFPSLFLLFLRRRLTLWHMAAILAGLLVWRCLRIGVFGTEPNTIYMSTDTRFDSILYGAVLAMMTARGVAARIFPATGAGRILWLGGAGAVLLACFLPDDDFFRETVRYSLQGLALMPVFHYAVTQPRLLPFRPLNWGWMRRIGFYSYSVYLIHTVLLANMDVFWQAAGLEGLPAILRALVTGALCLGYAVAVYHLAERPAKRWRARLTPVPR
ncbi:acyltransferase family protein [Mangrovicoccus algicola]|uniref:Acyltransferase n=1 Tax=Mangrovicoccus algicola TaxID=2771008 RepID=A0A8J7CJ93_9RHOB|nr:acyltransferase [Mangrovicoccus algicola]MBE3640530.1 acyltransferase [Mangrovicoccus algicola]